MRRTVDAHIKSLRAKLGNPGFSIATIRGLGYCLRIEDKAGVSTDDTSLSDMNHLETQRRVDMDCHQFDGN